MVIDCDSCVMRDLACGDCVVTFLSPRTSSATPAPPGVPAPAELSDSESRALAVLAGSGLVPPLRMSVRASPRAG